MWTLETALNRYAVWVNVFSIRPTMSHLPTSISQPSHRRASEVEWKKKIFCATQTHTSGVGQNSICLNIIEILAIFYSTFSPPPPPLSVTHLPSPHPPIMSISTVTAIAGAAAFSYDTTQQYNVMVFYIFSSNLWHEHLHTMFVHILLKFQFFPPSFPPFPIHSPLYCLVFFGEKLYKQILESCVSRINGVRWYMCTIESTKIWILLLSYTNNHTRSQ